MNFFKRKRTKKILFKKEIMKLIIGITKFVESIRSTKLETREGVFVNPDARDVRIVLIDISNRAKWSFFFFFFIDTSLTDFSQSSNVHASLSFTALPICHIDLFNHRF